jgi:Protein of unknown function (DUF2911)
MKRLLVCTGLLAAATALLGQGNPASPPEKVSQEIGGKAVTIEYSSPAVKGRQGKIFTKEGLISHNPHYPVWRAGANGATTLYAEGDLQIGSVAVPKGKYSLFVDIADPDHWVLIVSKQAGISGLAYDSSQDLGKVKMQMSTPSSLVENLKYTIDDLGGGKGKITLAWENHAASVPVSAK